MTRRQGSSRQGQDVQMPNLEPENPEHELGAS